MYCRNTMSAGRSGLVYELIDRQVCMRKDDSTEPTPTIEPLTSELPRFFNRLLDGWIGFKQRLPLNHIQDV
jgi:hypothetical protein